MRPPLPALLLLLAACGSSPPGPVGPPPTGNCTVVRMVSVQAGFSPAQVTVRPGGCVEFVNDDRSSAHNAASAQGTARDRQFTTAVLRAGERGRVVFNLAGEVEYICQVGSHATTMRGTVRVQ